MRNNEKIFLTREGLEKLKKEYEKLTEVRRKEIAKRIQKAREQGDLTENAEYDSARDEQAQIEGRILELGEILKRAEVVRKTKVGEKRVELGTRVKLHLEGQDQEFYIVGAPEADPVNGKISHESPLGQALLGKKVGDKIKVSTPAGEVSYKILEIIF